MCHSDLSPVRECGRLSVLASTGIQQWFHPGGMLIVDIPVDSPAQRLIHISECVLYCSLAVSSRNRNDCHGVVVVPPAGHHFVRKRQHLLLRAAARKVRLRYAYRIEAAVVLPDHLHAILRLPPGDADFPLRWRYLKTLFVRSLPRTEAIPANRARRGERGIWQRRYWEHLIRDAADLNAHVDYIHFNPVKHGLVSRVRDWPHSSFQSYVRAGVLPADWGGDQRDLPVAAWDVI